MVDQIRDRVLHAGQWRGAGDCAGVVDGEGVGEDLGRDLAVDGSWELLDLDQRGRDEVVREPFGEVSVNSAGSTGVLAV